MREECLLKSHLDFVVQAFKSEACVDVLPGVALDKNNEAWICIYLFIAINRCSSAWNQDYSFIAVTVHKLQK